MQGEHCHAGERAVQLLRHDDRFTGDQDVGEALDVLDVERDRQFPPRIPDLSRHRNGNLRLPLGDAEKTGDVVTLVENEGVRHVLRLVPVRGEIDQPHVADRNERIAEALTDLPPELDRRNPVSRLAGELALALLRIPQTEATDDRFRNDRRLRDVGDEFTTGEVTFADDRPISVDHSELDRIGVGMRFDCADALHGNLKRGHDSPQLADTKFLQAFRMFAAVFMK